MGMHEIKHLLHQIEDSFEHAGKHMHIALPTLMRKQSKRIAKIRHAFEEQDKAAKKVIADVKKEFAENKKFKEGAAKKLGDFAEKEAKHIIKGRHGVGDLDHLLKGVKKNKEEIYRMYAIAFASEYGESLATGTVANGLYDHYVENTPAGDALSREDFVKFVEKGEKLGHKGIGLKDAQYKAENVKKSDWLK